MLAPKVGDLIAVTAGMAVLVQGAAEHLWPTAADLTFPVVALVLLVIFWAALSAQWRSTESIARSNRASGDAFGGPAFAHVLGACLRLGAAPAIWVAIALVTSASLFAWNVITLRLALGALLLAVAILIGGMIHYVIVARHPGSNEEAPRKAR